MIPLPAAEPDAPWLFEVDESLWRLRRCRVCRCALDVSYTHTYVVQRQWWVKIGATNNPRRRIGELGRPAWRQHILYPEGMDWEEPLLTLAVIEGDIEHILHLRFAELHVRGEWFDPDDSMRAWLEEVA